MNYVDGFLIPLKKKKINAYKKMAKLGCNVWMKHGALDYYECVADDYSKHGLGFQKLCKLKSDETVIFAFIIYKSKAHRNQVNKKVMKDPKMQMTPEMIAAMPVDMKRFCMAGFKSLVQAK